MDAIERLLEHDRWATGRLLELSRGLTDEHLDRQFDIGHRTLRATYEHLIFIVEFWTRLARGRSIEEFDRADATIDGLSRRHERVYDDFAALARQMRDEGRLDDTFVDHWGERMTFGGVIMHVILHNAEHRTEAVHILHRLDAPGLPEEVEVDHGLWDLTERSA